MFVCLFLWSVIKADRPAVVSTDTGVDSSTRTLGLNWAPKAHPSSGDGAGVGVDKYSWDSDSDDNVVPGSELEKAVEDVPVVVANEPAVVSGSNVAEVIETKVLSLGIEGKTLSRELQDRLKKQEEDPEHFETPGSKFEKLFTDDKTNELIVREFMDRSYKSGGSPLG